MTFAPGSDLAECKKQLDEIYPALRFTFFKQDTRPVSIKDAFAVPDDRKLVEQLVRHLDAEHEVEYPGGLNPLLEDGGVSTDLVCGKGDRERVSE